MNGTEVIPREHYLEKLRGLRDFPIIKGLTGIRRCGKSTLMTEFIGSSRHQASPMTGSCTSISMTRCPASRPGGISSII